MVSLIIHSSLDPKAIMRPLSSASNVVSSESTMRTSQDLTLPAMKKLYANLQQQLKEYKRVNTFLQNKVDSYQIGEEVNNLKAIIHQQKLQITTLRDDNDSMAMIVRQQEKEIRQMKRDFKSTTFSTLQMEISNLQTKTKRLQLYLKQKQVTERSLLSQIHALSQHNTDLMQLQDRPVHDSIDELVQRSEASDEIEKLRAENVVLHKSVNRFRDMVYSLQRELSSLRDRRANGDIDAKMAEGPTRPKEVMTAFVTQRVIFTALLEKVSHKAKEGFPRTQGCEARRHRRAHRNYPP